MVAICARRLRCAGGGQGQSDEEVVLPEQVRCAGGGALALGRGRESAYRSGRTARASNSCLRLAFKLRCPAALDPVSASPRRSYLAGKECG